MADTDELLEATTALIPPLLTGIDVLAHAGRHMHPPNIPQLIGELTPYREPVKEGLDTFRAVEWPEHLQGFAAHANKAGDLIMQSFNEFLSAQNQSNPTMGAYRAMGYNTKATEAIYPVSMMLPPVSRFFLNPDQRDDDALLARIAAADATREHVGVMHAANTSDERGGFSMYVPEYYDGEEVPLIVAMHGGSGHGRSFLWTWLRTARSVNAIVISPTSKEGTWSLMGPDVDTDNLDAMVAYAKEHWNIDDQRVLLTGMSDGGTFSYVTGLREDAPFTHLAPSSASFHPMLLEAYEGARMQDLPLYIMHGALDWMFPVDVARAARDAFTAAGAVVEYREIADLSHTYPIEENARIMQWVDETADV
ncbi:MAG: dienelactone hydrolase family protein [Pseudomonadota bacterium]